VAGGLRVQGQPGLHIKTLPQKQNAKALWVLGKLILKKILCFQGNHCPMMKNNLLRPGLLK
jgi:hypothetical protein